MSTLLLQRNINTGELIALPPNTFAKNKIFQVSVLVPLTELTLWHDANTLAVITRCYDEFGAAVQPIVTQTLDSITFNFAQEYTGFINLLYLSPKNPRISGYFPNATQGEPYEAQLFALSGTAPYSFSILSGNLPVGLTLDPSTGLISGTPDFSSTGQINIVCEVRDFYNTPSTQVFSFNLLEGLYGRITKAGFRRITKAGNVRITKAQ